MKEQVNNAPSSTSSNVPKRTYAQTAAIQTIKFTYSQVDVQKVAIPSLSMIKTNHRIFLNPLKLPSTNQMTKPIRQETYLIIT